jgi:xanthine dehydrogenase accessory factor
VQFRDGIMNQSDFDQIPEIALDWHRDQRGAALATVIETWGSAPRPVGSQLVVSASGEMMGSVSGGCVEGAVVEEAKESLVDGKPRILEFGVSDDDAFSVGLACGGTIRVLVEPVGAAIPETLLVELVSARKDRRPIAYTVDLESWERQLSGPTPKTMDRFRSNQSGLENGSFVGIHNAPLRLFVVGAVHIAQTLVPMARACGYDPVLIDPREAFGSTARFPGETISHEWPDEVMATIGLDARSAVVTLSHDAKLDDPAIRTALASDVFYLGCLGSTRTHAKRVARLRGHGCTDADIARIHAPVGLAIGARSPAEIAVSIMAEITQELRSR